MTPVALTIAGSDPSGGAGVQADLKTFHQHGVYGEAVLTLLTVQNTRRVSQVVPLDPDLVAGQLAAVSEDIPPAAAKTGALGAAAIVEVVAAWAADSETPLVVDPVMISKHGSPLLSEDAAQALRRRLLPLARLATPNIPEAEKLAGVEIRGRDDMRTAAKRIAELGARAVLVKGGHLAAGEAAADLLLDGAEERWLEAPRVETRNTHGTGCVLSAAVAANLALGRGLSESVERAKAFVQRAIESAPGLGGGAGPLNLFAKP